MATLFGGAALGVLLQTMFDTLVKNPIKKGLIFEDELKDMKSTLEALDPKIKELKRLNMDLNQLLPETEEFVQVLEQGNKLVAKCLKIKNLSNAGKWPGYTNQLQKLNKSLNLLLSILQVQMAVDQKKVMADLDDIKNSLACKQIEVRGGWEVPEGPEFTVGLHKPLKELKMELLREESSMIVVTAPGGCGKTTLAKKLCRDGDIKDKFMNNIMFVKVSKTPNFNHIVQELYQYKGQKLPSLQDEEDAVNRLGRLLKDIKESPILLVLDDVWSESESLIDKFKFEIPGYKILVTSRFGFQTCDSSYELETLNDGDAMKLFRHHSLLDSGSSNIQDDLVKQVVQRCKRIPLALKLTGLTLRRQNRKIWQKELKKWSRDLSVLDTEAELLLCLQSSIDVLGEQHAILKECFMDLGSFPEDRRIPATALIDVWTELHRLDEDEATCKLFYLDKWSLANVVVTRQNAYEDNEYYDSEHDYHSEHFVTQHDMLRELAIHQSRQGPEEQRKRLIVEITGNNLPKWWKEHNNQPFNARLLAISTDESFSSEWCDIQLPEAEVLVLNFQSKKHVLPKFVKNMGKLKVLIITNIGFFPAELSDLQLLNSLTNLTRIRLERISMPSLKEISVVLEKLQKLSLFMCELGQAFGSIKISQVFPNLVEINIDYCNDLVEQLAGLSDLIKLNKLSITHCHKLSALPNEIGNLVNLEVLRLRSCINLEKLPDSICKLSKLLVLDISDCFSIRNLPEHIGELCSLTELIMKNCSRLHELPSSILDFEQLKNVVCDEQLKELWELYLPDNTNVKLWVAKDEINLNWLENHHF